MSCGTFPNQGSNPCHLHIGHKSFNHWTTGKSLEELLKQKYFVGLELSADVFIIDG